MTLTILVTVSILYLGNFFLLAHKFLEEPVPVRHVIGGLNEFGQFLRQEIQILHRPVRPEKVNWKEEGF